MTVRARPLSPHLQVYRWQLTNTLSILHRITGVGLAFGLVPLCCWFMAIAGGPASYARVMNVLSSPLGMLFLAGWTFAFMYHLLSGVRHLLWDAGYGFELGERRASGWFVVVGAVLLTVCTCWAVWHGGRP